MRRIAIVATLFGLGMFFQATPAAASSFNVSLSYDLSIPSGSGTSYFASIAEPLPNPFTVQVGDVVNVTLDFLPGQSLDLDDINSNQEAFFISLFGPSSTVTGGTESDTASMDLLGTSGSVANTNSTFVDGCGSGSGDAQICAFAIFDFTDSDASLNGISAQWTVAAIVGDTSLTVNQFDFAVSFYYGGPNTVTPMIPSATPEPGSLTLFGSGMVAMVFATKRRLFGKCVSSRTIVKMTHFIRMPSSARPYPA
jgi:hypothetical protein